MSKFQSKVPAADWDRALEGGLQMSRPNLLDNWYFADPINQRGQGEYTGPGYTIDRWTSSDYLTVTLGESGISLLKTNTNQYIFLSQIVEVSAGLAGRTLTFSILIDTPNISSLRVFVNGLSTLVASVSVKATNGVASLSFVVPEGATSLYVLFYPCFEAVIPSAPAMLKAVKLELGGTQTLARQDDSGGWVLNDPPPNKALELLKCQRYFQRYRTESLRPTYAEDCRPEMRAEPTKGTIAADGVTYYTLSADL